MTARKWACGMCGRLRSTPFCHECGSKRPDESCDQAVRIEDLRRAAIHFGNVEQRLANEAATLEGMKPQLSKLESSEKFGRYRAACDWAANALESKKHQF